MRWEGGVLSLDAGSAGVVADGSHWLAFDFGFVHVCDAECAGNGETISLAYV